MSVFESLFRSLAGWHDGVRIRVRDDVDTPLVSIHEAVHERIFAETPDGQVHSAFLRALKEGKVAPDDHESIKETVHGIFKHSRIAQETFANYLAIKQFSAASEGEYLRQLPLEYRKYFDLLADIFDDQIPSTYLQYVAGWATAVAVFSSNLILRVGELSIGEPILMTLEEQPDHRLTQLLNVLRRQDFQELRHRICEIANSECETLGIEPWDFFSESQWFNRMISGGAHSGDCGRIEEAMFADLTSWLRELVPFPYLSDEGREIVFDNFSNVLLKRFGVELFDTRSLIEPGNLHLSTLSRAVSLSRSRITNTNPIRPAIGDVAFLTNYTYWKDFVAFGIYSSCPPDNSSQWIILFWTSDPERNAASHYASFSADELRKFLTLWAQHRDAGENVPLLTAIVIAVRGALDLATILSETPVLVSDRQVSEKLCWYLWEGLFEFVYGSDKSDQTLYWVRIDLPEYEEHHGKPSALEYDGIVVFVAKPSENLIPGLFVRAMRHQAFAPFGSFLLALESTGKLKTMPEEMREWISPLATEALAVASTFWDEY